MNELLIDYLRTHSLSIRIFGNNPIWENWGWSQFVNSPSPNYLDIGFEPVLFRDIREIDISCTRTIKQGKRLPTKVTNLDNQIEHFLETNSYTFVKYSGYFKVLFTPAGASVF